MSFSATNHEENQPVHLVLKDSSVAVDHNLALYDATEQRYCPAGVYEILRTTTMQTRASRSNAQNCVHCKPVTSRIDPEHRLGGAGSGGGPNYPNM